MRVLYATAELYPWVKSGGLGDVSAALPPALTALGVDVRLVLPGFPGFLDAFPGITDVTRLHTPFAMERVRLAFAELPNNGQPVYLVDHPPFYDRPGSLYADPGGHDWGDNHRRFALLGWIAAAIAQGADPKWRPDIVHGHDWHAGLAPAYLKAAGAATASVFTVHNLAYQGSFWAGAFGELALPNDFYSINGVEYFGGVSFMKAGLFYADRLTTVSPTYAEEIKTPAFGMNLEGLLRARADALRGILNGVDPGVWDPQTDANLPQPYGLDNAPSGRKAAKTALQRRLGLLGDAEGPLFGAVTRLTWQKGMDLVLDAVGRFAEFGAQLALLGSGDAGLEAGFAAAAAAHPGRVGAVLGYDDALSHLIIGGSDIILVPSRFEPCGLTQLYALRYGTLPLVRRVGGLADSVVDATAVSLAEDIATGFAFDEDSPQALMSAIGRAAALFREPDMWRRMMRRAMAQDFSWEAAARRYIAVYRELRPGADHRRPHPPSPAGWVATLSHSGRGC